METLIYFLKTILASGILYGYYLVFLKDKTFHHYNRFYLLMIVPISLLLPLLKVSYFTMELNPKIVLLLENFKYQTIENTNDDFYFRFSFAVLGLVALFFILKFLLGILKIKKLKHEFPKEEIQGISFFNTNLENAPFSFFRNLFWKDSILLKSDLGQQILKHEMVHIEQKHSIDKLLIEIVKSIFWFNPFFWMMKKEIHLIHEYLADKKAVKKNDTKAFAEMLLASHFSGQVLPGSSPFLNSNLKKRLQMIQKSNTKYAYLRKILALPLLFLLAFAYLVNAKNKEIKATNEMIDHAVAQMQIAENHLQNDTMNTTKESETVFSTEESQTSSDKKLKKRSEKIMDDKVKSDEMYNPMTINLYRATDNNTFLISGKEVSRAEFIEFFIKHVKDKNYSFGSMDTTFSKLHESGKLAIFSASRNEEMSKDNEKLVEIFRKYKALQVQEKSDPKPEARIDKPWTLVQKIDTIKPSRDLATFFKKSDEERQKKVRERLAREKKLEAELIEFAKKNKVNKNFYKGRDYEKEPLTGKEIASLKDEAAEMHKLTTESLEGEKKEPYNDRYAFIKTNNIDNLVYDINGRLVKSENKNVDKVYLIPISQKEVNYFIDGKKVSKEKFLEFRADALDEEKFLREDSNVKSLRTTKVTDGGDFAYTMNYEIITK